MPPRRPTEDDRTDAIRELLVGLARGDGLEELQSSVEHLHPPNHTFPGEVFIGVAVQAMDVAAIEQGNVPYQELLDRHLEGYEFRGKRARKLQFAILTIGATRGGIAPDLLEEVAWWRTDDFWFYAMAAATAIIRASAERRATQIDAFVRELAYRVGTRIEGLSP